MKAQSESGMKIQNYIFHEPVEKKMFLRLRQIGVLNLGPSLTQQFRFHMINKTMNGISVVVCQRFAGYT